MSLARSRALLWVWLILTLPGAWGCESRRGLDPETRLGAVAIDVSIAPAVAGGAAAKATVTRGQLRITGAALQDEMVRTLAVVAGRIQATVEGVPVGPVRVALTLHDSSGSILWEGAAPVYVSAHTVARASISLHAVNNDAPRARFTVVPESGPAPTDFHFLAAVSDRHEEAAQLQIRWDFSGDGIYETDWSVAKEAIHRFPAPGKYSVHLQVRDGARLTTTVAHEVWVENTAPRARAGQDMVCRVGRVVTLDGRASTDPDGAALAYSWTQTAGVHVALQPADGPQPSFVAEMPGQVVFALVVSDGELFSPADEVVVTLIARPTTSTNTPPVADAGAALSGVVGERLVLDGSGSSDEDGDPLVFSWTQTHGPEVALLDAHAAMPEFLALEPGVYGFSLVVDDGAASSAVDEVEVRVVPREPPSNEPPVARVSGPDIVALELPLLLDGSASSDVDGDSLIYEWSQQSGPAQLVFSGDTPLLSTRAPMLGAYTFQLRVGDGMAFSAPVRITVHVVPEGFSAAEVLGVVFSSTQDGLPTLFCSSALGEGVVRLTSPTRGGDLEPDVSSTHGRIVFSSLRDGRMDPMIGGPAGEIYVIDRDGTDLRRLTDNDWPEGQPCWSPDGQRIAFSGARSVDALGNLNTDIYVIFASGSGLENLTPDSPVAEVDPDWSPDGARLVYAAYGGFDRRGVLQSDLVVMDLDDQRLRALTDTPFREFGPDWSPDGRRIAYTADEGGVLDVYVMNADGTGVFNVTNSPDSNDGDPAWSPDGHTLAFVSDRSGRAEIFLMDANGSQQRRLGDGFARASWPAWMAGPR